MYLFTILRVYNKLTPFSFNGKTEPMHGCKMHFKLQKKRKSAKAKNNDILRQEDKENSIENEWYALDNEIALE